MIPGSFKFEDTAVTVPAIISKSKLAQVRNNWETANILLAFLTKGSRMQECWIQLEVP